MAAETLWTGNNNPSPVPAGWTAVRIINFKTFQHYMDAKMWCYGNDTPGEFGFTSAVHLLGDLNQKGSIWAFSDPQVAFEFKLRFV